MSNQSLERDVDPHKQTRSGIHISCLAAIAANSTSDRAMIIGYAEHVVDSFELPMNPIDEKKPRRTISMLSVKAHVDKGTYQNMSVDEIVETAWNVNKEELLAGVGADKVA